MVPLVTIIKMLALSLALQGHECGKDVHCMYIQRGHQIQVEICSDRSSPSINDFDGPPHIIKYKGWTAYLPNTIKSCHTA